MLIMGIKKIDRESLKNAYQNLSLKEAMDQFGIKSTTTLYRLLDEANIPRKDQGRYIGLKSANRFELSE